MFEIIDTLQADIVRKVRYIPKKIFNNVLIFINKFNFAGIPGPDHPTSWTTSGRGGGSIQEWILKCFD